MLLGALADAGASLEAVQAAVDTLGGGPVRLTWGRVQRGGATAVTLRVRAPASTPRLPTWGRVREVVAFAALGDATRERALRVLDRLVEDHDDDQPPSEFAALDALAAIVATSAALSSLEAARLTTDVRAEDGDDPVCVALLVALTCGTGPAPQGRVSARGVGAHAHDERTAVVTIVDDGDPPPRSTDADGAVT